MLTRLNVEQLRSGDERRYHSAKSPTNKDCSQIRYRVTYIFLEDSIAVLYDGCSGVVDAPSGTVTLGVNMANGIEQKGIDTLQQCIKKCAAAGLGIPASVCIYTVSQKKTLI